MVADFFCIEVANLLCKAIRTGRCTRAPAEMALSALRRRGPARESALLKLRLAG